MMQGKEQIGCIFRGAKLSEFMPIAFWVCTTPVHWKYIYISYYKLATLGPTKLRDCIRELNLNYPPATNRVTW